MTVLLSLSRAATVSAIDSTVYSYEYSGVFTWGEVITSLCRDGWCRTQLPREFFEMKVPLNVYEKGFDDAFKALSMQAQADGYRLRKTGRKKPYTVIAELDEDSKSSYISCTDTSVKQVSSRDLIKHRLADSLKCAARDHLEDSLAHIVPVVTHPSVRYRVSFYVVSSSYLHDVGIDWTEMWANGDLVHRPSFISDWALMAVAQGDTTAEFRSVEVDLDSSAVLHWGSQRKETKSTVVYNNGVSQTDTEWRDYGLTLTLTRSMLEGIKADYKLAQRDENNSVIHGAFGGGGKDSIQAWGVYDSYQNSRRGIPILSSLPLIGYLFSEEKRDKVKSFFVIDVFPVSVRDTNSFVVQDSVRQVEIKEFEGVQDSTDSQPDSVDTQEAEMVNE